MFSITQFDTLEPQGYQIYINGTLHFVNIFWKRIPSCHSLSIVMTIIRIYYCSGTTEGVGHKDKSLDRQVNPISRKGGRGLLPPYGLVSPIFWSFHCACSAEQQQTTKTHVLVIHTQSRRKVCKSGEAQSSTPC